MTTNSRSGLSLHSAGRPAAASGGPWIRLLHNASQIASPICDVEAGAPFGFRSAVTWPLFRTRSMAWFTAAASSSNPKLYSSIAATLPIAPSGFALFCPAMSGAEPCTGSYRPVKAPDGRRSPSEAEGSLPMEPRQNRALVAQDVAEHILGDNDVEARRVQHQLHGAVVHQNMLQFDVRVIG